jgi:two-component system response regulator AtoC
MKPRLMIIDDEPSICASLALFLKNEYTVKTYTAANEGLNALREGFFDLVLLDLKIGASDGIQVLKEIKDYDSSIPVIIMTAYGNIRSSVDAIKNGAFNYLTKPLNLEEISVFIQHALDLRSLNEKLAYLNDELRSRNYFGDIIGKSPAMQNVYGIIEKVKDLDTCVLITGETGTGKELVARALHYLGNRKNEKFVAINCASIPENLLEEEFFGHKQGSFTGATRDKKGKFELADNGTLFLDEIGDMPLLLQGKILRVLQEKEFSPIGSNEVKKVNIRVLSATNKNLEQMVSKGRFREDLFYRLNVVEIGVPPLKDRREDIPLLCDYFIDKFSKEQNKKAIKLSEEVKQVLVSHDYKGNIRELSNILEYAIIMSSDNIIKTNDLPKELGTEENNKKKDDANGFKELLCSLSLRQVEKMTIEACLEKHEGKRKATAKQLGISERGLRNKINEYGLK